MNNLGNFVNRVIKFCNARYDAKVPDPLAYPVKGDGTDIPKPTTSSASSVPDREVFDDADRGFVDDVNVLLKEYLEAFESLKIRLALQTAMAVSGRGNQYLQDNQLNNALLANEPRRCATVVLVALNLVYQISALIQPFMPTTAELILKQLNAPARRLSETFGIDLLPGHSIGEAVYLFRRIDPDRAAFWRKQYGGNKPAVADGAASAPGTPAAAGKKKGKSSAASAAAKAQLDTPAYTGPKTPELLELEKRVAEQGEKVRSVKAGKQEGVASDEVAALLKLKKDLADLVTSLSRESPPTRSGLRGLTVSAEVQVTTAPE